MKYIGIVFYDLKRLSYFYANQPPFLPNKIVGADFSTFILAKFVV